MTTATITVTDQHRQLDRLSDLPPRILLGPGPSNAHPRVIQAQLQPIVGHHDPAFFEVMDDIKELLRYAWQTDNEYTIAISGTGSAGMEAGLANIVEPGDVVLVGVMGFFGRRLAIMAGLYGGDVRLLETTWGTSFTLDEIRAGLEEHRPAVLALVHAETSTGARQPIEGVAELCREHGCLLVLDTVTSLGGVPLALDAWGVDVAYSGSQKCLGCPPGASPLTFSPRAMEKIRGRKHPIANWYLNALLLEPFWFGSPRGYHHTAPITTMYTLREGLRLVAEEGLEARWARHQATAELLWEGLAEIDLTCHVERSIRLPSLTSVRVPDGVDAARVTRSLLNNYNIEIGNGLGDLAGKVWRVGLMGYNSRRENVAVLLKALQEVLATA